MATLGEVEKEMDTSSSIENERVNRIYEKETDKIFFFNNI